MTEGMVKNSVCFTPHSVIKRGKPELIRIEAAKTERAHRIGLDSGLFRSPQVLEYDEEQGALVLERLHGLQEFRVIASKADRGLSLAKKIGAALAAVHQHLILPPEMQFPLCRELNFDGTQVFIHGDFNGYNVCVESTSDLPVILDWQTTARHGEGATYGSRYFDLMWFVNSLLWTPTPRYLLSDPVSPIAKAFIEEYVKAFGDAVNSKELSQYAKQFFDHKLPARKQQAHWRSRPLLFRSRQLTQRFIQSLQSS